MNFIIEQYCRKGVFITASNNKTNYFNYLVSNNYRYKSWTIIISPSGKIIEEWRKNTLIRPLRVVFLGETLICIQDYGISIILRILTATSRIITCNYMYVYMYKGSSIKCWYSVGACYLQVFLYEASTVTV